MYKVWTVFKDNGVIVEYYVVNTTSHVVQSVWKELIPAQQTRDNLNRLAGAA